MEKAEVQGYLITDDILETLPESEDFQREHLEEILLHLRESGIDIYDAKADLDDPGHAAGGYR